MSKFNALNDSNIKTVSLHTLGCKLNYSETSTIAKSFSDKGFLLKNFSESSDVFVLNTCSVTENADRECRQIVRSILRKNPETYVIVTGCYAQLQPEEIAQMEGVDLVLGIKDKFRLFDYIDNLEKKELSCADVHHSAVEEAVEFNEAFSADTDSRTRAFLKIQDGCSYKCSFCTIPLARGSSRSLEIKKVIENAKKIIDSGYKEIILTGVNTGDYFYRNGREYRLIDVLAELNKLDIERIRISSIEPNLLTGDIISLVKSSGKFCNHFHIPLQSADPEILKLMKRRYKTGYYHDLIHKLNEEIADVGIGVDVITGFPGETEERFNNTFNFLDNLPVSYLHVFSYSERKNTLAASLPGAVDINDRRKRSHLLRKLSEKKRYEFYEKYLNSEQKVLFETKKDDGYVYGYTTNYIKVRSGSRDIENKIKKALITGLDGANPAECELL